RLPASETLANTSALVNRLSRDRSDLYKIVHKSLQSRRVDAIELNRRSAQYPCALVRTQCVEEWSQGLPHAGVAARDDRDWPIPAIHQTLGAENVEGTIEERRNRVRRSLRRIAHRRVQSADLSVDVR